ncbi:MAG TPA: ABC transporter permease [Desertimonas sp.]|jgi:NitT/TauT family transport system permease protein|nr:ABC transporter permease [Desertimonas sp.]
MTFRHVISTVWPPVLFGVAFLVAWELAVAAFDWQEYFLPAPSVIWQAFVDNSDIVREAAIVSGQNALVGLVVGTVLGVAMSFLLMRFRLLNDMVSPLAVALNAIPIVVLVAIFNNQFATTSEVPRRLMVTLIVYFVVLVNVAKGLRQVDATHLELLHSYAASPFDVLRKARVPNAVPYFFTALRVAAPLAVITAFVAEYFGGPQNGLGSRITATVSGSRATMWAYVLAAMLLGLLFYLVSIALESLTTQHRGASPKGDNT